MRSRQYKTLTVPCLPACICMLNRLCCSYLNAASEGCGEPFCDQMVLSAEGGIYDTEDVVLASRPITPILDSSCGGGRREAKIAPRSFKGKKSSKSVAKLTKVANDAVVASSDTTHSLYSGAATIYFGPMTVNSRFYESKVTQGWFEYGECRLTAFSNASS